MIKALVIALVTLGLWSVGIIQTALILTMAYFG